MKKEVLIFVFLIIFLIGFVSATDYYIDATNGNDGNTGTSEAQAWKTISKVNSMSFNPGDNILFKRGETWREQLNVPSSGAAGNPITFGAYGSGEKPVISGADVVSGWTQYSGNVWQATLTTQPNLVFFNNVKGTKENSIGNLDSANEWYWSSNVLYVYSTVDPDTAYTNPGIEASQRLRGVLVFQVDYIIVDNITTKYAIENGLQLTRVHYVNITNILSTYNYVDGVLVVGNVAEENNEITIEDSEVSYNGNDGIEISSYTHNTTIRKVEAHHNSIGGTFISSAGIYLAKIPSHAGSTWTNNIVEYSVSHDNGGSPGINDAGAGIWYDEFHDGGGHFIRYNKAYGNRGPGIWVENTWGGGMTVHNNIVYDNTNNDCSDCGIGIRIGVYNSGVEVYNNVMYGNRINFYTGGYSFSAHKPFTNNIFKNNIAYGAITRDLSAKYGGENDGTYGSGNVYEYNSFGPENSNFIEWGNGAYKSTYDAWETASGNCGSDGCSNSVEADPLFISPSTGDFHLQSTSPAIDAGVDVGLTQDFDGNPIVGLPDIGAYEYISSSSTCSSAADTNTDGVVSMVELMSYISDWKAGSVTMVNLMTAIGEWKNGCS